MSVTKDLTMGYTSFFWGCGKFAISPYTATFFSIAQPSNRSQPDNINITAAILVTGILTFAIPILPALFAITSAIAMVAVSLAISSMFLLYPIALLCDIMANTTTKGNTQHL